MLDEVAFDWWPILSRSFRCIVANEGFSMIAGLRDYNSFRPCIGVGMLLCDSGSVALVAPECRRARIVTPGTTPVTPVYNSTIAAISEAISVDFNRPLCTIHTEVGQARESTLKLSGSQVQ